MNLSINTPQPYIEMYSVCHLTTELTGGSGIATQRIHKALLAKNISSKLVFRKGTSQLLHSNRDHRHTSIIWRNLESIATTQQWKQIDSERSLFTKPQWIYQTKLQDIAPKASLINLHWISRWLDQPSFFNSIPSDIPVVWSLHDMNPITGGCHHALDCDRFTSHCANCPSLKKSGDRDQSWQNFEIKAKLYQKLNLHLVGNSTWTTAQAQKSALGKYARSIRTIHLGIDTNEYQPIDKAIAKAALKINPNQLAIAFACADLSDRNKNLAILIEAINELAKHQLITLIIFGAGQIPTLNSQINIISLGHLSSSHLQSLAYSAADIFVMPSRIESFGLTALEAMACGTPVLAFRTGGIPDLVHHRETGWLADQISSVQSLYQGLEWLAHHPQECLAMGKAARDRVEKEFSSQLMADRYISLYQELLHR
ncbi:glycosyltransferase [Pseudanabaena sp. FACHB-1277]|uniref:Glycosyltransferase n=1 Tax=Pseudanabaena cinerea FACHB-1277 TaxID=2949581 RepID=A0A926US86_9CYAN|nr:glycosyltransferase [Pseudanabaena cinerea]MBD2150281.1 glycosyltransferase [Pseudanabaena cinerea FACHB-1277]